jgi:hypothetical protein
MQMSLFKQFNQHLIYPVKVSEVLTFSVGMFGEILNARY